MSATRLFISTGDTRLDQFICSKDQDWQLGRGRGLQVDPHRPVCVLIRGAPGTYKSLLAGQIVETYAKHHKCLVPYFALEETEETVAARFAGLFKMAGWNGAEQAEAGNDPQAPVVATYGAWEASGEGRTELEEAWSLRGGVVVATPRSLNQVAEGLEDERPVQEVVCPIELSSVASLDGRVIPQALKDSLRRQDVKLLPQATVQVVKAGDQWVVRDAYSDFLLERGPQAIEVTHRRRATERALVETVLDGMAELLGRCRMIATGELDPPAGSGALPLGIFALDSLNVLEHMVSPNGRLHRVSLRDVLRHFGRGMGTNCVVIYESEGAVGRATTAREAYVADAVIGLSADEGGRGDHWLALEKVRDHNIQSGRFLVEVRPDEGVRVVPPIRAVLRESPFVTARPGPGQRDRLRFGIEKFDKQLRPTYVVREEEGRQGLQEGTLTVIAGPAACRKTYLGLAFIGQGLRPLPDSDPRGEVVGYIDFRSAKEDLRDLSRRLWRVGEPDGVEEHCWQNLFAAGYLDAGRPAGSIDEKLDEVRSFVAVRMAEGNRRRRLVVNDLAALEAAFGVDRMREFMGGLEHLSEVNGITVVGIYSTDPTTAFGATGPVLEAADNLIVCHRPEAVGSRGAVAVMVRRYEGASGRGHVLELRYDPVDEKLEVLSGVFEQVVELPEGKVGVGLTRVYYYAGETPSQRRFCETTERRLMATAPRITDSAVRRELEFVKFGPGELNNADDLIRAVLSDPPSTRLRMTEVVMLDEPWAQALVPREAPRLADLLGAIAWPEWQQRREEGAPSLIPRLLRAEPRLYGMPYHLNFSSLCYRRDYLRQARPRLDRRLKRWLTENGDVRAGIRWANVAEIAEAVAEDVSVQTHPVRSLHVDLLSREDWSCILLELCGSKLWDGLDPAVPSTKMLADFIGPLLEPLVRTIHRWVWLRWAECSGPAPSLAQSAAPNGEPGADPVHRTAGEDSRPVSGESRVETEVETDWVFARCWQSTRLHCERRLADRRGLTYPTGLIGCLPVPSVAGTGGEGISISGGWYLGVLAHSQNPIRGAGVVRSLTSYDNQNELFRQAVGIPPYLVVTAMGMDATTSRPAEPDLRGTGFLQGLKGLQVRARSRCEIPGYFHVSPALADLCDTLWRVARAHRAEASAVDDALQLAPARLEVLRQAPAPAS